MSGYFFFGIICNGKRHVLSSTEWQVILPNSFFLLMGFLAIKGEVHIWWSLFFIWKPTKKKGLKKHWSLEHFEIVPTSAPWSRPLLFLQFTPLPWHFAQFHTWYERFDFDPDDPHTITADASIALQICKSNFSCTSWNYHLYSSWKQLLTNFDILKTPYVTSGKYRGDCVILTVMQCTVFTPSQLSNLWWMSNSSKSFHTAMKTGSSRRFNRYPTTYRWASCPLPFTKD